MLGLFGILISLSLLIWLAYRGWSVLLIAPVVAMLCAAISREPLLASWTQIFMPGAGRFVVQWFPIFLLGGMFGKLMEDSRSISSISRGLTARLGTSRTMLSVVLASAVVTYGGVSVFVAFFVLVPMADQMFRAANLPRRLMPAAIGLGAFTFTMSVMPGTPSVNNAIPMPYFGTTTFAAPGLSLIASGIILLFGMWWLNRIEAAARLAGEGYTPLAGFEGTCITEKTRVQSTVAGDFDPAELDSSKQSLSEPPFSLAVLPLIVVITINFLLSLVILPRLDFSFLSELRWGGTSISSVIGIWSVAVALASGCLTVVIVNFGRIPSLRQTIDAGANASVLPLMTVASLVGFGAVVASLPAFAMVRNTVLAVQGGPLINITVAMNTLAALTGTASGGMAIALDALGENFLQLAKESNVNPELMHRLTTMSAGTLDSLPHNGTVLMLLGISGLTHRESYFDMVMTVIASCVLALIAVLILGSLFGSF